MGISREQELNHWCSQGLHQLRKLAEEKVCNLSCVNFALASCLVTVNMSAKKYALKTAELKHTPKR